MTRARLNILAAALFAAVPARTQVLERAWQTALQGVQAAANQPAPKAPAPLDGLVDKVGETRRAGKTPIILFDLDDTLMDTAPRHLRILKEFCAQDAVKNKFPVEVAKIEAELAKDPKVSYSMADTVKAMGVSDKDFLDRLQKFWGPLFFSNDYLTEDAAVPGGPAYAARLKARGATIIYITGRWEDLREGTEKALRKHGYPMPDGLTVHLMMKPEKTQKDDEYKDAKLKDIAKMGEVIGGFENEPKNINIFQTHFPNGMMFFLETRHSGRTDASGRPVEPNKGVLRTADFR